MAGLYNSSMNKSLLFGALWLACGICSAGTLSFTGTGTFSSIDTPDTFVTPGDNFSLNFLVNTNPVTNSSNSTSVSFDVPVSGFSYDLNQQPVSVPQPTEITFYTSADGGGFAVQFASAEFIFGSAQLFSGTTAAPVFSLGTFSTQSYTFLDNSNVDSNSAAVTLANVPEPSSLLLVLCGGIGLLAVGIGKSFSFR